MTLITDDTSECTTNQTQIQGLDLDLEPKRFGSEGSFVEPNLPTIVQSMASKTLEESQLCGGPT